MPLVMVDDLVVLAQGEAAHDSRQRACREPAGQCEHDQRANQMETESHCAYSLERWQPLAQPGAACVNCTVSVAYLNAAQVFRRHV